MILNIPATKSETITPITQNVNSMETLLTRKIKEDRKTFSFIEIGYTAGTFGDIKESGSYGFSSTSLPWNITENLYAGFHASSLNFIFGHVPSDNATNVFKLGPAIGYDLSCPEKR